MTDILDYPDNLVLHLEREQRSYKIFTTEKRGTFKVIHGLSIKDGVIDTSYINEKQLKQMMVDNVINGYDIKTNLAFKKGFHGIVNELAKEREEHIKRLTISTEECQDVISAEIIDDSEPEKECLKDLDEKLDEITEKYF